MIDSIRWWLVKLLVGNRPVMMNMFVNGRVAVRKDSLIVGNTITGNVGRGLFIEE